MKLLNYQYQSEACLGAQLDVYVVDLNRAHKATLQRQPEELAVADTRVPASMIDFLQGGEASMDAARKALAFVQARLAEGQDLEAQGLLRPLDAITFLPPVLRPGKMICVGMNYYSFIEGIGETVPKYPTLFHKTSTPLNGHGQPIIIPPVTKQVVPEGELAVIIGKQGRYIPESEAFAHIAGYTCANDVCARDLEFRTSQWASGKMLDTFGPLGPALVTRDEIADPNALGIKTLLNGKVIQDGNTAGMVFSTPQLIHEISSIATLHVGDVILTGTPTDLGFLSPPVFLQPGDTVSVEIEGVGILSNPLVAEAL